MLYWTLHLNRMRFAENIVWKRKYRYPFCEDAGQKYNLMPPAVIGNIFGLFLFTHCVNTERNHLPKQLRQSIICFFVVGTKKKEHQNIISTCINDYLLIYRWCNYSVYHNYLISQDTCTFANWYFTYDLYTNMTEDVTCYMYARKIYLSTILFEMTI